MQNKKFKNPIYINRFFEFFVLQATHFRWCGSRSMCTCFLWTLHV